MNNKIYIGQTWKSLKRRLTQHFANKKRNKLTNAIKSYGKKVFKIEIIMIVHTQDIADYWETYFISAFNTVSSGYNIQEGGSRGKQSEITKKEDFGKSYGT